MRALIDAGSREEAQRRRTAHEENKCAGHAAACAAPSSITSRDQDLPRIKHIAGWKVAAFASVAFAVAFVIFGGFSMGYTLRNVALLATAGALLGAIAAPDLEPKSFLYPELWQVFFAILSSILVPVSRDAGPIGYLIAIVIGAVLGFYARYWTKYIDPP